MGTAVSFEGCNLVLGEDLPCFRNRVGIVSCWQLNDTELTEVINQRRVYAFVLSQPEQPPMYVGSERTVRSMASDYGVWRRASTHQGHWSEA